jgi:lipopolysaccharide export system permease protein
MKLLLQRYLAAQFILPLVLSTLFFISFLLTFELFKITEILISRDISIGFILGLVGNISLTFIPLSLPIAVFFSTIYCLNRISLDSEYIAMRAGGMTKTTILIPFLIIASLLTMSVYQFNQNIIPQSNKEFRKKVNLLTSSGLLASIKEGQFFSLIPNVILFAGKSTKYGKDLEEVFLHVKQKKEKKVIFASKGNLSFERNSSKSFEKLTLTLYDGNVVTDNGMGSIEKINFSKYVFPVSKSRLSNSFSLKETMLTSSELESVLKMTQKEAEKKYKFNEKDYFNAKYEYWNRKNGALICFIFCFLGFTLGISSHRSKSKNSGLLGIGALIGYYGLFFSLASMAKKEIIPIPVAIFIPITVICALGIYLFRKLDWQS